MIGRNLITSDRDQVTVDRDPITVERAKFSEENNGWDGLNSIAFSDNSNKYIDFGNATAFKNLFDGTRPFSVSLWLKFSSSGGVFIGKYSNAEDSSGRGFIIYTSGTATLHVLLRHLFASSSQLSANLGSRSTDTWFNLVVTYSGNGLGSGLKSYINGIPSTVASGTLAGSTATNGVGSLGNTYQTNQRLFSVCNYGIWDKELTFDEVIELFANGRNYNLLDSVVPPTVRYYPVLSTDDLTDATGHVADLVGGVDGIPRNTSSANLSSSVPIVEPKIARTVMRPQYKVISFGKANLTNKDTNGGLVTITNEPRAGADGAIITGASSSAANTADGFNEGVQYTIDNPILSSAYPDPMNCILFVENQYRYVDSSTGAPGVGLIYGDRFGAGFDVGANIFSTWITPTASSDEGTITTRSPLHRTVGILTIPPSYSITGYQGILNYHGTLDSFGATVGNNTGTRSGNILTDKWTYSIFHDSATAMNTDISSKHKFAIAKLFPDSDPITIDAEWTDIKVSDLDIANPVGSYGSQTATLTQNGDYIDVSTTGDNTLNDGLGECINYKLIDDPVGWGDGIGKYIVVRVETLTAPSQDANGFGIQLGGYDGNMTNPNADACIGIGVKSTTNGSGEWCPTMSNSTTNSSNVASSGATCVVYGVLPVWGRVGNKDNPVGARQAVMTGEHAWSYNTVTDAWINPDNQASSSARVCTGNPDQLTGAFRLGVSVQTPAVLTNCTFTVRISYKVLPYPQPFRGIDN